MKVTLQVCNIIIGQENIKIKRLFLSSEQDETGDFTGLFSKKENSPALNSAPQKNLL